MCRTSSVSGGVNNGWAMPFRRGVGPFNCCTDVSDAIGKVRFAVGALFRTPGPVINCCNAPGAIQPSLGRCPRRALQQNIKPTETASLFGAC